MEYEDMIFLLHALQKSETFVDVGANAGAYTVLASKVIGSNSTAFEPIPETSNLLSDQVQINRIENIVEIKNMGVGDKQDELLFTNDSGAMNRVSLNDEAENTIRIKVTTLDSELNKDTNYFLKIDVEGYEYNVIEGASDLLASNKVSAIIIELNGSGNQFGHTDIDVHKKIISYGFIPISYNPINREIDQLDDIKTKNIGNTIYIRDIDAITERCKAAPIHTIHTAAGIKI
jgi:FkbM family methyltransferase